MLEAPAAVVPAREYDAQRAIRLRDASGHGRRPTPRSSPTRFEVTTPANVLLRPEELAGNLDFIKLEAVTIRLAALS